MSSTDSSSANGTHAAGPAPSDPDAIRAEIEQTRADLADTVDALSAKLDVKGQAKAKAAEVKDQATTDDGKPRPEVLAAAAGVLLLVVGLIWWKRR